ncbi:hypothetical protein JCM1841_004774 [Sporobolomyces salmonicolor]
MSAVGMPTADAPSAASTEGASTTGKVATTQGTGQGDALDKGIDSLLTKSGHTQNHSTVEKISDGARSLFKKVTGKNAPIADKEYK